MIKCSINVLLSKITRLFNLILDCGYYPETWNHGLIYSIHKNSSKKDSLNYRGFTLLSSLGKLFSSLVYNSIENEIVSKDKLSPSQASFRKDYRLNMLKTLVVQIKGNRTDRKNTSYNQINMQIAEGIPYTPK